jgi:hypothetical protein
MIDRIRIRICIHISIRIHIRIRIQIQIHICAHIRFYNHTHTYIHIHAWCYFNYWLMNAICTRWFVIETIRKWTKNCPTLLSHHADNVKIAASILISMILSSRLESSHPVRQAWHAWQLLSPRYSFGFIREQSSDGALRDMENIARIQIISNHIISECFNDWMEFFNLYNSRIYDIFMHSELIRMNLQIVSDVHLPVFMTNINIKDFLPSEKNI